MNNDIKQGSHCAIYGCIRAINEINDKRVIGDDIQLDRELRSKINTRTLFRFSDGKHRDVLKFNEATRQLRSDIDAMNLGDAFSPAPKYVVTSKYNLYYNKYKT